MLDRTESVVDTDYLVIGAGAMGMAFTDTIVTESNATVVIVDRHDQPGGHWNDAYPFVHLHSASAHYGVNSTQLGEETIDRDGLNRGFFEAASAAQIRSYFDRVMKRRFLPSGRVHYFSMCEYRDGKYVSLISGAEYRVNVHTKIVDATYTGTEVPSRRKPKFSVAQGVRCIAPNDLSQVADRAERFTVVGAGKTGIDTCLWLLSHGVASDRITWIMPRDSWLLDRQHVQPRREFFTQRMEALALQTELICQAESIDHLFSLLSSHGQLLRIDENVTPERYRCATVSRAELAELRRINNVVRLGHVQRIDAERIFLNRGSVPAELGTIYVDCTTSGLGAGKAKPIFNGRTITLQAVRTCQQCFSSALIAHIELSQRTDAEKNRLCKPIPLPLLDTDWLTMFHANLGNQLQWSTHPDIRDWISKSRLDLNYGHTTMTTDERAIIQRFKDNAGPAAIKLTGLLNETSLPIAV